MCLTLKTIFLQVYAYRVVELEKKYNYILINKIGTSYFDSDNSSNSNDVTKMGLLTAILAAIFMTGEVMQEGEYHK